MKYDFSYIVHNTSEVKHFLVRADDYNEAKFTFMGECPDCQGACEVSTGNKLILHSVLRIVDVKCIDDSKLTDFRLEVITRDVLRFVRDKICKENSACFLDFMHNLNITDEELEGLGFDEDVKICNKNNKDEIER